MVWEERTVSGKLDVGKFTMGDILIYYVKDMFYVNRRYQRKLVWGTKEKQLLIDSVIRKIPIPALLIAEYDVPETKDSDEVHEVLEIVDGMQRLNAIVSFMLGEFPIKYDGEWCYFDPMAYQETFILVQENKLVPKSPLLPRDFCMEFSRLFIPVVSIGNDDEMIELVFSRINSTGRKISSHDLRQSAAIGEFPDLVRRIASRIRRDYTYDDRVLLSDMPKISVGRVSEGYGVSVDDAFWRRHNLIGYQSMRESADEECIEVLVAALLLDRACKKDKDFLDELYQKDDKLNKKLEEQISRIGKDVLEDRFVAVFDVFDRIFASVDSDFSSFVYSGEKVKGKLHAFNVLFMALYKLLERGLVLGDGVAAAKSILSVRNMLNDFSQEWGVVVDNLCGVLGSSFCVRVERQKNPYENVITKRLSSSKIESAFTEYKIGISDFNSLNVSDECIHRMSKALVAMANTINPNGDMGLVIIGVADNADAAKDWVSAYKPQEYPLVVNQRYVPGIEREAQKLCPKGKDYLECYEKLLRKRISREPISQKLKDFILQTMQVINYEGVSVAILMSDKVEEVSLYDNEKYVREGSETIKV